MDVWRGHLVRRGYSIADTAGPWPPASQIRVGLIMTTTQGFWPRIYRSALVLGALLIMAAAPARAENPHVLLKTDLGEITIELFHQQAPVTVENFLAYVDSHFYDGTIFHRVIPGFVAQGGGLTYDFTPKPTRDPIVHESDNGLRNAPMTL